MLNKEFYQNIPMRVNKLALVSNDENLTSDLIWLKSVILLRIKQEQNHTLVYQIRCIAGLISTQSRYKIVRYGATDSSSCIVT